MWVTQWVNQSVSQSSSQSISHLVSHLATQSVSQSVSKSDSWSVSRSVTQSKSESQLVRQSINQFILIHRELIRAHITEINAITDNFHHPTQTLLWFHTYVACLFRKLCSSKIHRGTFLWGRDKPCHWEESKRCQWKGPSYFVSRMAAQKKRLSVIFVTHSSVKEDFVAHDRSIENGLRYSRHARQCKSKGSALHSILPKIRVSLTFF